MLKKNRDAAAQRLIKQLEMLFVYLGASDVAFKLNHYSDVLGSSTLSRDAVMGYNSNPWLSGLRGAWERSICWIGGDDHFHSLQGQGVPWNIVAAKWSQHYRTRQSPLTSADFDCFSHYAYQQIAPSGKQRQCWTSIWGFMGHKWLPLTPPPKTSPRMLRWYTEGQKVLLSVAASAPAFWHVKLKMEDVIPGLSLPTDSIGVREVLRLRGVPAGRQRRAALLHWVETEAYVRKHMRGATQCNMGGFLCEIEASQEDNLENALSRENRETMRKTQPRADRRSIRKRLLKRS